MGKTYCFPCIFAHSLQYTCSLHSQKHPHWAIYVSFHIIMPTIISICGHNRHYFDDFAHFHSRKPFFIIFLATFGQKQLFPLRLCPRLLILAGIIHIALNNFSKKHFNLPKQKNLSIPYDINKFHLIPYTLNITFTLILLPSPSSSTEAVISPSIRFISFLQIYNPRPLPFSFSTLLPL